MVRGQRLVRGLPRAVKREYGGRRSEAIRCSARPSYVGSILCDGSSGLSLVSDERRRCLGCKRTTNAHQTVRFASYVACILRENRTWPSSFLFRPYFDAGPFDPVEGWFLCSSSRYCHDIPEGAASDRVTGRDFDRPQSTDKRPWEEAQEGPDSIAVTGSGIPRARHEGRSTGSAGDEHLDAASSECTCCITCYLAYLLFCCLSQ